MARETAEFDVMEQAEEIPQSAAVCMVEDRMVLVTNMKGTRWVLPKGHLEPNDPSFSFRAGCEAWEEAGVKGNLVPDSLGSYPYQKRGRNYRAQVFLINECTLADDWPEAGKRKRILVAPTRAADMVREPELRQILRELGS
jgi:8-oxo-dGTP pyrophosphatase MutT (NUDIX family)